MSESELSRRSFLRLVGAGGTFLMLGWVQEACGYAAQPAAGSGAGLAPNAFVKVDGKGLVTVTIPKSDMGQGIRTTLAMVVAEELDADWTKVRVVQAPGDASRYGSQMTGGSTSVRTRYAGFRQAGATARAMLLAAAAKKWGVDAGTLRTEPGVVVNPAGGAKLTYGQLAGGASTLAVPESVPLKDRSEFRIMGKGTRRLDTPDIVAGKPVYAQDKQPPGAAYAVLARRPAYGATLKSVNDAAARKTPGVLDVFRMDNAVAVIATNTWAAMQGRDALELEWDPGPNARLNTEELGRRMRAALAEFPSQAPAGATRVTATYAFPYLAHATMEPQNAVADVREDRVEIWVPTQGADGAQAAAARSLGVPLESVILNTTLLGGGFGRRLSQEFVVEAVTLSRLAKRPIKLVWSRDDDMRNDNFRPMAYHAFEGYVGADGSVQSWRQQIVEAGGQRAATFGAGRLPYDIPEVQVAQGGAASPVRTGAWRSVDHTHTIPAMECFLDELASAAKKDPYRLRMSLLRNARVKKLLEVVATRSGWGKPLPKGEGMGIACFSGYGSHIAHVIHVAVKGEAIQIKKVWTAVDVGLAINPLGIEAQVEGACCDAIATALHAAITVDRGGIAESNYSDYEWMRFEETPEFDTHIEVTDNDPGGMGEVGYPAVMPAIANALFAATGKRVRKWPVRVSELV